MNNSQKGSGLVLGVILISLIGVASAIFQSPKGGVRSNAQFSSAAIAVSDAVSSDANSSGVTTNRTISGIQQKPQGIEKECPLGTEQKVDVGKLDGADVASITESEGVDDADCIVEWCDEFGSCFRISADEASKIKSSCSDKKENCFKETISAIKFKGGKGLPKEKAKEFGKSIKKTLTSYPSSFSNSLSDAFKANRDAIQQTREQIANLKKKLANISGSGGPSDTTAPDKNPKKIQAEIKALKDRLPGLEERENLIAKRLPIPTRDTDGSGLFGKKRKSKTGPFSAQTRGFGKGFDPLRNPEMTGGDATLKAQRTGPTPGSFRAAQEEGKKNSDKLLGILGKYEVKKVANLLEVAYKYKDQGLPGLDVWEGTKKFIDKSYEDAKRFLKEKIIASTNKNGYVSSQDEYAPPIHPKSKYYAYQDLKKIGAIPDGFGKEYEDTMSEYKKTSDSLKAVRRKIGDLRRGIDTTTSDVEYVKELYKEVEKNDFKGEKVKELRQYLKDEGHNIKVDGKFESKIKSALESYYNSSSEYIRHTKSKIGELKATEKRLNNEYNRISDMATKERERLFIQLRGDYLGHLEDDDGVSIYTKTYKRKLKELEGASTVQDIYRSIGVPKSTKGRVFRFDDPDVNIPSPYLKAAIARAKKLAKGDVNSDFYNFVINPAKETLERRKIRPADINGIVISNSDSIAYVRMPGGRIVLQDINATVPYGAKKLNAEGLTEDDLKDIKDQSETEIPSIQQAIASGRASRDISYKESGTIGPQEEVARRVAEEAQRIARETQRRLSEAQQRGSSGLNGFDLGKLFSGLGLGDHGSLSGASRAQLETLCRQCVGGSCSAQAQYACRQLSGNVEIQSGLRGILSKLAGLGGGKKGGGKGSNKSGASGGRRSSRKAREDRNACAQYKGTRLVNGRCTCPSGQSYINNKCQARKPLPPKGEENVRLVAEISCAPRLQDKGAPVAISFSCRGARASKGDGFSTDGRLNGSVTASADFDERNPGALNRIYALTCSSKGKTTTDTCAVRINNSRIVMILNENPTKENKTVDIGWISVGTKSCSLSSPDDTEQARVFNEKSKNAVARNGVFRTDKIKEDMNIEIKCETLAGSTKIERDKIVVIK